MIRTNIYFPRDVHQKLQQVANKEGVSMAELVREFVEHELDKEIKKEPAAATLLRMAANAGSSSVGDLAKKHDYYLYGEGSEYGRSFRRRRRINRTK